jgi:hypothetical protein
MTFHHGTVSVIPLGDKVDQTEAGPLIGKEIQVSVVVNDPPEVRGTSLFIPDPGGNVINLNRAITTATLEWALRDLGLTLTTGDLAQVMFSRGQS